MPPREAPDAKFLELLDAHNVLVAREPVENEPLIISIKGLIGEGLDRMAYDTRYDHVFATTMLGVVTAAAGLEVVPPLTDEQKQALQDQHNTFSTLADQTARRNRRNPTDTSAINTDIPKAPKEK